MKSVSFHIVISVFPDADNVSTSTFDEVALALDDHNSTFKGTPKTTNWEFEIESVEWDYD